MGDIIHFKTRKRGVSGLAFAAIVAAASVVVFGAVVSSRIVGPSALQAISSLAQNAASFSICSGPVRVTCVVDGDTFWLNSSKIRIADIDTPEISEPKCASEKALGERAKLRLRELLNAGKFELAAWQGRDEDQYGRKLRVVMRDGRSLGDQLVSEGLARTWSGRREPWC